MKLFAPITSQQFAQMAMHRVDPMMFPNKPYDDRYELAARKPVTTYTYERKYVVPEPVKYPEPMHFVTLPRKKELDSNDTILRTLENRRKNEEYMHKYNAFLHGQK